MAQSPVDHPSKLKRGFTAVRPALPQLCWLHDQPLVTSEPEGQG